MDSKFACWSVLLSGAVAALAVCLVNGAASAQGLEKLPIGTVVKGTAVLGERQFPLPDGEWRLIAKQVTRSGVEIARIYLVQIEGNSLKAAIQAAASLSASAGGWTRRRDICDRADTHFNESDQNYNVSNTECWTLNHIGLTMSGSPGQVHVDFYRYTDDKNRPRTALVNGYYIVKGFHFLEVQYGYNPELEGFEPTPNSDWRGNPWHRDAVATDPKKATLIARLRAEGEKLFPLVKKGFGGGLPPGQVSTSPTN
jgi:hypothetical protein